MIDDGLFQRLTEPGTATNALIATRLYSVDLPEPCDFPAATHQLISNLEERTLDDEGVPVSVTARIQFEGWSREKKAAQNVVKAIRADLINFDGELPSGDIVANAWIENGPKLQYIEELELYLVQVDWKILYTPAD